MSNKDTYKRKHRYLDNQINTLEKHNSYNRTLISSLKKKKLRLKDKMISDSRDSARRNKYNLHEYIKRAMSMTAWQSFSYMIYWIHMLHKISQLCDKVDSLKKTADHLRQLKLVRIKLLVLRLIILSPRYRQSVFWLQTINPTITNLTINQIKSKKNL